DLQVQTDEDCRQHDKLPEQYSLQERCLSLLLGEVEEGDARGPGGLQEGDTNQIVTALKGKLEADLSRLSGDNEELISEFRWAEERAKKAVTGMSAARFVPPVPQEDHELEVEIDQEQKCHVETVMCFRKAERGAGVSRWRRGGPQDQPAHEGGAGGEAAEQAPTSPTRGQ
ncbi:hypothetical protein NHX12_032411, partial [Muraenolepis orangiensis]